MYGLIGHPLTHSYSEKLHRFFARYNYRLFDILPEEIPFFLEKAEWEGLNVTIPYKQSVMPYLDEISEQATQIGAVNTVQKENGKRKGYNTDFFGLTYMLSRAGMDWSGKEILILGTGGASKTAQYYAQNCGAERVYTVSRTGEINYENVYEKTNPHYLFNATPIGMYPHVDELKVDLKKFSRLSGVADAVYNPLCTRLMYTAKKLKIPYTGGLSMLVAQAEASKAIFLQEEIDYSEIEQVTLALEKEEKNILLIGMPSSGKTTIGKKLAERLHRSFFDCDEEITQQTGLTPAEIIFSKGETYFRTVETSVLRQLTDKRGIVLATGGGTPCQEENHFLLRQNSVNFLLLRSLSSLTSVDRPILQQCGGEKLWQMRKECYFSTADFVVDNNGSIEKTIQQIEEKL